MQTITEFIKNIVQPLVGKVGVRENIPASLRAAGLPVSHMHTRKGSGFSGQVWQETTCLVTVQIGATEYKRRNGWKYSIINVVDIQFANAGEITSFFRNKTIDEILVDLD